MNEHLMRAIAFDRLAFIERHGEPCRDCTGAGVKNYASTATWRGGYGGQAFTPDVCDRCWGSGVEGKPWPSHREFLAVREGLTRPTGDAFEVGQLRQEPGRTSNIRVPRIVRILELNVQGIRGKNGAAPAAKVDTAIRDRHSGGWRFYGPTVRIRLDRLRKWKVINPLTGEPKP